MKFEFNNIPISTIVGAKWNTFKDIVHERRIDDEYRGKFRLTKFLSFIITALSPLENMRYNRLLKKGKLKIEQDPVFVLGHWRSGTTFVHNVLSCDPQFGYTTTYQTVFPNVMLVGQWLFKWVMGKVMPDKRPVDGLELQPDLPQEEEFALANMMPYSYYNFWLFPQDMMEYCDKYLLFNDTTELELSTFEESFKKLIRISMYNTGGTRYLSKNPPHTGRVKELLKIFPNAKFVYLMRNPYTVFESTKSFFTKTIQPLKFHEREDKHIEKDFVEIYSRMYDKYQADKALIPAGNLIEMKFEDFEADPVGMTQKIYETLSLEGFEEAQEAMEAYAGGKKGHKKNKYKYAPQTVKIVEEKWSRALKDWGYNLATEQAEAAKSDEPQTEAKTEPQATTNEK
ncbi:MAG: sulfotransferase [Rikenellaceae bacterium]